MKEEKFKPAVSPAQNITPYYSMPWVFQHQELFTSTTVERPWDQKKLINKLNHINFIDGYVSLLLEHKKTNEYILLKAYPQPCIKDELICRLGLQDDLIDLTEYSFNYLIIDDGLNAILAPVQLVNIESNSIKLNLPDESRFIRTRKTRRHYCQGITCEVSQDDFNTQGILVDFTPSAFGIKLSGSKTIKKFNENNPALINLYQNSTKLFSGSCRCIRNGIKSHDGKVVFEPINTQMALFPKRKMRNLRQQIAPSFSVTFKHPLIQKNMERDIFEISAAGFSVRDNLEEEVLLPGMIIPNMCIVYAGILKMNCSAQVVYRDENQENNIVQCGLAIADMDVQSYTFLNHILGVYIDNNARVSTAVDMDALWEFFFEAGFIYGEKYVYLQPYRKTFKETYRKLYQDNPDIARHFVYKRNGKIYGHIAMVHAYPPSWLIHHFTALRIGGRLPGVVVLKQITQYVSSYTRLPSAGMDHVMTYYQPDNKIIDRIFGNFTRHLNDLRGSSLDVFSYFLFVKNPSNHKLPQNWSLKKSNSTDLDKLRKFYELSSGGLLLSAMGLETSPESIKKLFTKAGFNRDYMTYCLCYEEKQIAFFIVNQSDLGLNLSDLLNGIKIIVLDKDKLPWAILSVALNNLSSIFAEEKIPLLIFPSEYLASQNITEEKQYTLWILQLKHSSDDYLEFMNKTMKLTGNK